MHKRIVREQLEPYKEWKEKQEREPVQKEKGPAEPERPYHQDTIEAAGKEWSRANNLKELRDLNEYLWDNYEERIPKDEYKKLASWIRDKERLGDRAPEQSKKDEPAKTGKDRDAFEFQGDRYGKNDSYEKLTGLASKLRDSEERLPFDDYQKLRGWMEDRDRERWSGALEKTIEATHKKFERSKTMTDLKAAEGGRVIEPQLEQLMRNPIVGLFMTEAAIASEIVRSIPLDDRNRDYLKERIDGLDEARKNLDEREKERKFDGIFVNKMPWEIRSKEERDREAREKIEKAKEEAERKREEEKKKRKKDKERKRDDWDRFDPWGRF
jgi:hypothetical protein